MVKIVGWDIYLSVGDTTALKFRPKRINRNLTAADRIVFTMTDRVGNVLIEKVVKPGNNNLAIISFSNEDTKNLDDGTYKYDIRYVINPYWSDGKIVGGQQVVTPKEAQKFVLIPVVGRV